jgi:hypothetical protein
LQLPKKAQYLRIQDCAGGDLCGEGQLAKLDVTV